MEDARTARDRRSWSRVLMQHLQYILYHLVVTGMYVAYKCQRVCIGLHGCKTNVALVAPQSKKKSILKKATPESPSTVLALVLVLIPGKCKSEPRREADVQPPRSTMLKGVCGTVKGPLCTRKTNVRIRCWPSDKKARESCATQSAQQQCC